MQFQTSGTISRSIGVPVHRVSYVVRARGIAAVGRAGNTLLYDDDAAKRIVAELQAIAAKQAGPTLP